jgi:hypothetical protein
MIGLTQYTPAVINLIIDREKFYPIVISTVNHSEDKKLKAFLSKETDRTKVILMDTIPVLQHYNSKHDLSKLKIILFDSILKLKQQPLELIDAVMRNGDDTAEYFHIKPDILNTALEDCSEGVPTIKVENKRVKEVTKETAKENDQTLASLIKRSTKSLSKKKQKGLTRKILEYIIGTRRVSRLPRTKARYGIVDNSIEEYLSGKYNERLKSVFSDISSGKATLDSLEGLCLTRTVNLEDIKLLTEQEQSPTEHKARKKKNAKVKKEK